MRDFLAYWWRCTQSALRGNVSFANNWQWLVGVPIITVIINYLTAHNGNIKPSVGSTVLDGLVVAIGAFAITWVVAFFVRLMQTPVTLSREQQSEIFRLELLAGVSQKPTFKIFIEEVPFNDLERNYSDTEYLYRVGITNTDPKNTYEAYVVIEDVSPSVGISPATRLTSIGRSGENRAYHIAPTDTAFLNLIQLHKSRPIFGSDENFEPYPEFSVRKSDTSFINLISEFERDARKIGELKRGSRYVGTLAAHAPGAISSRLIFSVDVGENGDLDVQSDTRQ